MEKTPLKRGTGLKRRPSKNRATIRKLDSMLSELVKSRGCQARGMFDVKCSSQLHAHHISRRRHYVNRWLPENMLCLCANHHRHIHDHPADELALVAHVYGEGHYDMLINREYVIKWNKDYEAVEARLKQAANNTKQHTKGDQNGKH